MVDESTTRPEKTMTTPATAMAQPLWVDIASKPYNGHLLKRESKARGQLRRQLTPIALRCNTSIISMRDDDAAAMVTHYVAFMGPQNQGID